MITLKTEKSLPDKIKADVLAFFVGEEKKLFTQIKASVQRWFPSVAAGLESPSFTGKLQETLTLFPSERTRTAVLLLGVGPTEKLTLEKLRRVAATAAKTANSLKAQSLAFTEPDQEILSPARLDKNLQNVGTALGEGALLSLYKYDKYLTGTNKKPVTLETISLTSNSTPRTLELRKGAMLARILCDATYLARDLANAPANEIYPETLAERANAIGKKNGISVTILDERRIRQLKMGGVLAVAQGSDRPPRVIIMEYNKRSQPTIVLVGKGVTFDAGGISIKPAAGMSEMKMDMSGAAAVIGTLHAVARLKLPLHVVGIIPAVENLLGGKAMKPGDIITHLNGKTSEVDNTDAEGRLILADALSYAERYKPDLVIDLATLTGHVVVALGNHATGMMGNDQATMDRLREAGERTYERVWQLPLFEEYEKRNTSDVADVKNSGGRPAGAITAALFLKQFIGKYKWVHLDIAGTAILDEALEYVPKGGSGVGVRLLTDFLLHWTTDTLSR